MVIENVIISVDFGHKNDMSVETVFRIDKGRSIILSQKIIGCAKDFDTEEKRNDYLNKERCNLRNRHWKKQQSKSLYQAMQ